MKRAHYELHYLSVPEAGIRFCDQGGKKVLKSSTASTRTVASDSARSESGRNHIVKLTANTSKLGIGVLALLLGSAGSAFAQQNSRQFVRYDDFISNTRAANFDDFAARPDTKVRDASAFEEMRQSILDRYEGVNITHSFVLGQMHYDCVPVQQQPALRKYNLQSVAPAPPQSLAPRLAAAQNNVKSANLAPEVGQDGFGNSTQCEAGTVPLLRNTLDAMSRFPSLQDYYRKPASGAVREAQEKAHGSGEFATPGGAAHKYSYTYQWVNNLGGNSNLNIWDPYVNTGAGEVFSLSQEWYVGGSGANTQTEEVGWVVYPAMFGDERTHFFIFSTPNNYASGCWNNTCGDFVQVADSGLLGAYFNTVSAHGGTQYEFNAEYYLYQGNWWLNYQGTWIGYYPGSMYHGGQNTRNAQLIEFGTESVGTSVWPNEGSGYWPSSGWTWAAYQRNLWYISTSTSYASYWDTLNPSIPSPACYNIAGPYNSTGAWTRYFFEGGPGGYGC
jgi:hypothetical protein